MFERLRSAFGAFIEAASRRTPKESEVARLLSDLEIALLQNDVAAEVVADLSSKMKQILVGTKVERSVDLGLVVRNKLEEALRGIFLNHQADSIINRIKSKNSSGEPFIIVFLGINGTGKTTTIAKFAHMLKRAGFSVVLACADTHRAGAIEQLAEHASRVSCKMVAQSYGADPAAVARDAVLYAKNHRVNVVLVDTAGRMQTSRNLMEEMAKIIRVVKPDMKIFIGDALAGNDAVSQAKEFLQFTDFDGAILTKLDADVKGGAAVSIAFSTGRPILYLGVGQSYDDLIPFDVNSFVGSILEN